MHHSLFSSNTKHTDDPELDGMRKNLLQIFNDNKIHLVLSGHSHCFEWTVQSPIRDGHNICYVVSGGGGRRLSGSVLVELIPDIDQDGLEDSPVAKKQLNFLDKAQSKFYATSYHYLKIKVNNEVLEICPVGVPGSGKRVNPMPVNKIIVEMDNCERDDKEKDMMRCFKLEERTLKFIRVDRAGNQTFSE